MVLKWFIFFILISAWSYGQVEEKSIIHNDYEGIGLEGDSSNVQVATEFGVVLMGGSTDVDEALQWMIDRAKGGDFVIIRASGSTGYNDYIKGLGNLNSAETLLIDSREKAMKETVGKRIREAEALFIAGGDQWNYVNFWKDSEVSSAIQYLIEKKKIPIGGTSAGCAVLSQIIFDSQHDTAFSPVALANPYDSTVSISKSFVNISFLKNTIADQHYAPRERLGRHVTFMARMTKDFGIKQPKGIGVDEKTAVCVDKNGDAEVFGSGKAYFLISNGTLPEICKDKTKLSWNNNGNALRAYIFQATKAGTNAFNLNSWPSKNATERWGVEDGVLKRKVN